MTIKETAGKTLLYFYQLQRTVPLSMPNRQLGFLDRKNGGGVYLTSDKKWLTSNLLDINPSSSDIYNAFAFLINKQFIESKGRTNAGAKIYVGIEMTSAGIDIIEGIEGGANGRQAFGDTFNIQVDGNMDVESLVSQTLGILVDQSQQ